VVGGRHVLVEHERPGLGGDEQPGVTGLAAGHQQQSQPGALEQQRAFPAGAPRDGDDRAAERHPQGAVAERVAFRHLDAGHPSDRQEAHIDTDRGAEGDQPLPPGEHHHHQRHGGVQQATRLGREDHFPRLRGQRPRQAETTRHELQRDEESEAHDHCRGPDDHPGLTPRGVLVLVSAFYSRKHPRRYRYQLFDRFSSF
jgi:hypothetical protein